MNYSHDYHAGNPADVHKHLTLIECLIALKIKSTPLFYLDTHAGQAFTDLQATNAKKTGEYQQGIAKLLAAENRPGILNPYCDAMYKLNEQKDFLNSLHYYPGSSWIAQHFMSTSDRLILCELEEDVFEKLRNAYRRVKNVNVHNQNGYQALKAFLPPKENRGLVFIDPPYEQADEFSHCVQQLRLAHSKWPNGCYLIWYPIKDRKKCEDFHHELTQTHIPSVYVSEWNWLPNDVANRLHGSGMVLVNPPWKIEDKLRAINRSLHQCFNISSTGSCNQTNRWLTPRP